MITIVYEAHEPCGCGSKQPFGQCCLKDGHIKLREKALQPPGVSTGISCPKCLFVADHNCCGHMSGDHVISRSVLSVLDQTKIGISDQRGRRTHSIDSSSLKTKRLCRRHNAALSPLDAEAGRFFRAFASINSAINKQASAQRLFLFHGTDLERWLLKTAIMTYYSGSADINPRTASLPANLSELFRYTLPKPLGLYLKCGSHLAPSFTTEAAVTVALSVFDRTVAGVVVTLGGLEIRLLLVPPPDSLLAELSYRPSMLGFVHDNQAYAIAIAYPEPGGRDLWITTTPSDLTTFAGIYGANGRLPSL